MSDRPWTTSNLIDEYWIVELDEDLRIKGDELSPKVQAEWYSYRLGAMANSGKILYPQEDIPWWEQE